MSDQISPLIEKKSWVIEIVGSIDDREHRAEIAVVDMTAADAFGTALDAWLTEVCPDPDEDGDILGAQLLSVSIRPVRILMARSA